MKTNTIILALALGAVASALAADPSASTAKSTLKSTTASFDAITIKIPEPSWQVANPFAPVKLGEQKDKIDRLGAISSRPWTQIVGWHSAEPSSFMDVRTARAGWPLLWFGADPER